jgi:transposase
MSRMAKTGGRRTRRKFSDEFRAGAVRLVLDEGRTAGAVARELDLTESALRAWVARAQADRTNGKSGGLTTAEREELARLRKETRQLRLERDILKKAAVPSSPGRTSKVRVRPEGEGRGAGHDAVSGPQGFAQRVLRLVHAPGVGACAA